MIYTFAEKDCIVFKPLQLKFEMETLI